jgi:SET domain-containing protein
LRSWSVFTIKEFMKPHHKVYVRLGLSHVHGIGVLAIRDIAEGVNVFGILRCIPTVNVNKNDIKRLPHDIQKFYLDFCVWRGDIIHCPQNFNEMNIAWYLNHSDNPNVKAEMNEEICFVSLRPIEKGEELLVDYRTFSDHYE